MKVSFLLSDAMYFYTILGLSGPFFTNRIVNIIQSPGMDKRDGCVYCLVCQAPSKKSS
jgi:hypothetical protein